MTSKDAYQYFVLRAQEIAISNNRTPVNWYASCLFFVYLQYKDWPSVLRKTDNLMHKGLCTTWPTLFCREVVPIRLIEIQFIKRGDKL